MSILKKGSKGSAVKDLQKSLNKAGAKPKLKEDGDFGPLTDKAVRVYQKKNGLKPDGRVGPLTLASIKIGGKLPEMTVGDYVKRTAVLQNSWQHNQDNIKSLLTLQSEIEGLNAVVSKEVPLVDKMFVENYKHWEKISDLCTQLIAKQKEFTTILLKDPKKAKVLAGECEALDKQVETIGLTKIRPNQEKANKSVLKTRTKLDSSTKAIKDILDAVAKREEKFRS